MNVVVCVCGGIAVYKACDLVRRYKKEGHDVFVIMTKNATEFVTPLTFQTLSNNPVTVEMFKEVTNWNIEHIELAKRADLVVVAPATANILGKVSSGIADDLLTTAIMATKAPVLFVPAMNTNMYENKLVQDNIRRLTEYGYYFIEPEVGEMACGDVGKGRFPDIEVIYEKSVKLLVNKTDLNSCKILITAGPTREPIDPVRYISNHSSGKMGYAIAKEGFNRGAEVMLISGPVTLKPPTGVNIVNVTTAIEMHREVLDRFNDYDVIIMVAAVADYRCETTQDKKIKKKSDTLALNMVKNPDIARDVGKNKGNKLLVGFCAETDDLINNANTKIKNKNLDMIVANDVTLKDAGFGVDTNIVSIADKFGNIYNYPLMSKTDVANKIIDHIVRLKDQLI